MAKVAYKQQQKNLFLITLKLEVQDQGTAMVSSGPQTADILL